MCFFPEKINQWKIAIEIVDLPIKNGYFSHHIGNVIVPTDELHQFSEGLVAQPPTSPDSPDVCPPVP